MPENVTYIGTNAFSYCSKLDSVFFLKVLRLLLIKHLDLSLQKLEGFMLRSTKNNGIR